MPKEGEIRRANEVGKYIGGDGHGAKYIWCACEKCSKERWVHYRVKEKKPYSLLCLSCAHQGERSSRWKGGRRKDTKGYIQVWLSKDDFFYPMVDNHGYVKEHRLVIAKHLGRCLSPFEFVHHKNGDKTDNKFENLELTGSISEHSRDHSRGYKDGYAKGLIDGRDKRIKELLGEIKSLEAYNEVKN